MITATRPWSGPPVTITGHEHEPNWRDRAHCYGMDTDLFYVPDGVRGKLKDRIIAEAKAVCAGCPVRSDCAQEAASRPERYGIWGGLDETERGYYRSGQPRKKVTT